MADDKQQQIDNLNSEIRKTETQIGETQDEISGLNNKKERLQKAYDKLQKEKDTAEDIKKECIRVVDKSYKWKGDHRNDFDINGTLLKMYNRQYIRSLDEVSDALLDAINDLNAQINDKNGFLGWLKQRWSDCETALRKLFN